jgi:hypothetical protein
LTEGNCRYRIIMMTTPYSGMVSDNTIVPNKKPMKF